MSQQEFLAALSQFVLNYTTEDRDDFRFQWNGKESEHFEDENEEIRGFIADWILDNPDAAPLPLISDVLLEDALWAQQAWRAPLQLGPLLELLLRRGGVSCLATFSEVVTACSTSISQPMATALLSQLKALPARASDPTLETTMDLLQRLC